ncbi:bacteriophage CI repressor [Pseudoxanthomonas sp. X-1]|uniref:bacteriophage CI repressor n=1 Tax=Pseudoxanthomonas sp. X-1 TaxID=2571115 RepID=UPI00110A3CF8|nr:bacteriophage CI repressor [Pseudoxanthomonas sp. X-1]TMN24520.1 bacteriophage CI repressor [Pseudoxanthomonas sp. X-1]UAY75213.1 helix-turn-helix domain containing protein [Pseudoxanthomonas sp. X-1]
MNITKREVRAALGFTKDKQLAEFFGVGKAAISAWKEDKPIVRARQIELVARAPDRFKFDADGRVVAYGAQLEPMETGKTVALSPVKD